MKEILPRTSNSDRRPIIARTVIEIVSSFRNGYHWNVSSLAMASGKMVNFCGTGREGNIGGKGEIRGMNGFRG